MGKILIITFLLALSVSLTARRSMVSGRRTGDADRQVTFRSLDVRIASLLF